MDVTLGPILALQDSTDDRWVVSVLVSYRGAGDAPRIRFQVGDAQEQSAAPDIAETFQNLGRGTRTVCRYMLETPVWEAGYAVTYWIDGHDDEIWHYHVPQKGRDTLRLGYASCNGFSHAKTERDVSDKYDRWRHLLDRHAAQPLHVLLLGGDQVYGDPIWERAAPIRHWVEQEGERKWKAAFRKDMEKATERFFGELYEDRWNKEPVRRALAQIPSLMMWDDHDIFDGWGSHPDEQRLCPVYQGIYGTAARFFRVFQLQNLGDAAGRQALCPEYNYTYGMSVGEVAILALDLRAERTEDRVMSLEAWDQVFAWMDNNLEGKTHLLVMSSVPVVHLDFALAEKALAILPGQQDLEDDLRDHWLSRPHKKQRLRLIHRLFQYAQDNSMRITILSGDIHVAGMGQLEDRRRRDRRVEETTITQLISSPVVHPTPPQMLLYAYDALNFFEGEEEVDQGLYSRMVEFPASDHRFIDRRNWLELDVELSKKKRIWANWHPEDEPEPYTAVVHAVGRG